ncbi:hypothetical protein [Galbitalea soli]|uniref:Uncharacterized protein n=1 Tax=Galbitalea soli TaxID=1268042 RepID=A0A7C9PMM7_9MICO|nr:hypothetical protein [Galbitalea soli]NEM90891.1 hypothetical protein [Galbitalea soli]
MTGGQTDSELVTPAIKNDSGEFFTEAQIDTVWRAVTAHYPEPLPEGVSFPAVAPSFFHPNDGRNTLFQAGLPDEIAASFWDCAWLKVSIEAANAGKGDIAKSATAELDNYESLPSISSEHASEFRAAIAKYAAESHIQDLQEAQRQFECGGLE